MISFEFILLVALLALFYFWYVAIITRRNKALEALSGIDVQLKKRLDLIPNILKIAKKFMEHEEKIFGEVTALREGLQKNYDPKNAEEVERHLKLSEALSGKMSGFMLRAENYPELRSSQNMIEAQQSYNEVEAQIAAARRFYNAAVNSLANSIQIFPGNLFAKIIGVKPMPLYEADDAAKQSVDAEKFL
jgi:LemA protein